MHPGRSISAGWGFYAGVTAKTLDDLWASRDAHYEQTFTNQSQVSVEHNLGKRPAVTIIDSAGDECEDGSSILAQMHSPCPSRQEW